VRISQLATESILTVSEGTGKCETGKALSQKFDIDGSIVFLTSRETLTAAKNIRTESTQSCAPRERNLVGMVLGQLRATVPHDLFWLEGWNCSAIDHFE
jgi:hypothetical protein